MYWPNFLSVDLRFDLREGSELKNVPKSGKSPYFSWPPSSPRMIWIFLNLGKIVDAPSTSDLIWDKSEIRKILNFGNSPKNHFKTNLFLEAIASLDHPIPQGFSSSLLKPYIKAVTYFCEVEWWRTLMMECVTFIYYIVKNGDTFHHQSSPPFNFTRICNRFYIGL